MEPTLEGPFWVYPIGFVRSPIKDVGRQQEDNKADEDYWQEVEAEIVIREELAPALDGIGGYSHVVVLWGAAPYL